MMAIVLRKGTAAAHYIMAGPQANNNNAFTLGTATTEIYVMHGETAAVASFARTARQGEGRGQIPRARDRADEQDGQGVLRQVEAGVLREDGARRRGGGDDGHQEISRRFRELLLPEPGIDLPAAPDDAAEDHQGLKTKRERQDDLSRARDAHPRAEVGRRAPAAKWGQGRACPPAVRDKEWIVDPPVFLRQDFPQDVLRLMRGSLSSTAPSLFEMRWTWVSTAMPRPPKPSVMTMLAVFRPTPLMASSSSMLSGSTAIFLDDSSRHLFNKARLHPVEAHRIDELLDLFGRDREDLVRRAGLFHQPLHGLFRCLVLCSQAQQTADEHEKGVALTCCDPRNNGHVGLVELR